MDETQQSNLGRAAREPGRALRYAWSRLRGGLARFRCVFRKRVTIGKGFRLLGRLRIRGPGRVVLGDDVYVDGPLTVSLPTYSPEAEIRIGAGSYLNGTRMGCAERITIGENCILADCRITDTHFHSLYPGRRSDPSLVGVRSVEIGDDCWVAADAFILPGTRIRRGSTVAAGAVVMGRFPEKVVIAGNPARVIMGVGEPPSAGGRR
jgi:acetyltransferase-like isoleucine patch superfamily enzyme